MRLLLVLVFCILERVYSDCEIFSGGDGPPTHATGEMRIPKDHTDEWVAPYACPEFADKPSCCGAWSNDAAFENFQKIKTAFGNQGGGCDICAANIMRFFCYYACSPDQSDWLKFWKYDQIEAWNDTSGKLVTMDVARVNMTFNAQQACDLFQSCSKISFLTQISAGGSALGFFTFLFDRGVVESWTKVDVKVVNQGGLQFVTPPYKCNQTFPEGRDEFGYEIPGTCPCNFCQDSCEPLTYVTYGSVSDGFSSGRVILAYLFAVLLTIGVTFLRSFRKQRTEHAPRRNSGQRNLIESSTTR